MVTLVYISCLIDPITLIWVSSERCIPPAELEYYYKWCQFCSKEVASEVEQRPTLVTCFTGANGLNFVSSHVFVHVFVTTSCSTIKGCCCCYCCCRHCSIQKSRDFPWVFFISLGWSKWQKPRITSGEVEMAWREKRQKQNYFKCQNLSTLSKDYQNRLALKDFWINKLNAV